MTQVAYDFPDRAFCPDCTLLVHSGGLTKRGESFYCLKCGFKRDPRTGEVQEPQK